jgi:hypothetical protein
MDRLDGLQIIQAVFGAPGAKAAGGSRVGPAGVRVADLRGEVGIPVDRDRSFRPIVTDDSGLW